MMPIVDEQGYCVSIEYVPKYRILQECTCFEESDTPNLSGVIPCRFFCGCCSICFYEMETE